MIVNDLFPFEYVKKGTRVVIYGLGMFGTSYIEQIEAAKWCEIAGVSDADLGKREVSNYPFFEVGKINSVEADYIVIAIERVDLVNQVYWTLVNLGIPESKIISVCARTRTDYKYSPVNANKETPPHILINLGGGGLGDCIIGSSVYEKFVSMLQNIEVKIDVRCRVIYGKAVFANKEYISSIIDKDAAIDYKYYDLVLHLAHVIQISKYDKDRCRDFPFALSEKIRLIKNSFEDLSREILSVQYRNTINIRRACVRGWDVYRTLGLGDILNLHAGMVHITLSEACFPKYSELQLDKYITLNRGAGEPSYPTTKLQLKVWPLAYYERLIPMLKGKYPEYEVIQLGGSDTEQIQGVDRCIKGQDLELVKYILKGSSLHFDCEGGLVHLATALGTKCAVVFGPTPVEYYGYPQNINITAGKCHNCIALSEDWFTECLRGQEEPECMYGITPEMVFEKISNYLDSRERLEEEL